MEQRLEMRTEQRVTMQMATKLAGVLLTATLALSAYAWSGQSQTIGAVGAEVTQQRQVQAQIREDVVRLQTQYDAIKAQLDRMERALERLQQTGGTR